MTSEKVMEPTSKEMAALTLVTGTMTWEKELALNLSTQALRSKVKYGEEIESKEEDLLFQTRLNLKREKMQFLLMI